MKAVMPDVPEHILAWRRRTGADRWDEMWDGVLHMSPSPNREHQVLMAKLLRWLEDNWAAVTGGEVFLQRNIAEPGTWPDNFRVPDLVLLTPERFAIDRNLYIDGGPDVVIEIRSANDESYEKLPFYAKIGVREAWIIDRDTKRPEVYELFGEAMQPRQPGDDGWLRSAATGVEMQAAEGKLAVRLADRPESPARLP